MSHEIAPLVNLLTVGQSFASLYFAEHPRVRSAADEFVHRLRLFLAAHSKPYLELGSVRQRLVYQGEMLVGPTLIAKRLIDCLQLLRADGIRIQREVGVGELLSFFELSGSLQKPLPDLGEGRELLRTRHIQHIELLQSFGEADAPEPDVAGIAAGLDSAIGIYQSLFEVVEDSHSKAEHGTDVGVNGSRATVESLLAGIQSNPEQLLQLAYYPDYDNYTIGHSVRVALFALLTGQSLGLAFHELVELGTAALLHDVGKSKIPFEILFKEGRLNDEERRVMNKHAWLGGEILIESEDVSDAAIGAAFGHHISYDRSGYPEIPAWARVGTFTSLVQVCDVFEALTAVRPYKVGYSPAKAYRLLLGEHQRFHPGMLRAFIKAIGLYPPGSRITLASGEKALVVRPSAALDRPVIRISHDAHGEEVAACDAHDIDLSLSEHRPVVIQELTLGDDRSLQAEAEMVEPLPEPCGC